MKNSEDIDLSFPMLEYSKYSTPWDLKCLLYKGGAAIRTDLFADSLNRGELGSIRTERAALVSNLHAALTDNLVSGTSRFTVENKILVLRQFVAWCDITESVFSMQEVAASYVRWCDYLLDLSRVNKSVSSHSIYYKSRSVGYMLDCVLERSISLTKNIRIRKPGRGRNALGSNAEKQSLTSSFAFGHALVDICNALSREACLGNLPVPIRFRTGQIIYKWSGLRDPTLIDKSRAKPRTILHIEESKKRFQAYESDKTVRTRYPLINLRIICEMLVFIAQTGMNLAQVHSLRKDQFHYKSHMDGYQVRCYKRRREGVVLFEIFEGYKEWFERYLKYRDQWFPGEPEGLVFPLVRRGGRSIEKAPQLALVKQIMAELDMPFLGPRKLRGARINWLLRETQEPSHVAELAQHSLETLRRVYNKPSPQIAKIEIARFHQESDPFLQSPAPGNCEAVTPTPLVGISKFAPRPDCINASGCLFCTQHRDIESLDHIWSLSSLRYLKSIELSRYQPSKSNPKTHPALLVVERLTAKLLFFKESKATLRQWVEEADARIKEEDYHPAWDGFIRLAELEEGGL